MSVSEIKFSQAPQVVNRDLTTMYRNQFGIGQIVENSRERFRSEIQQ